MVVHGSSCYGWLCSSCDPGLLPNRGCRMGSTVSDGPSWTAVFSRSFSVSSDRSSTSSFSIPFEPGTPPFPIRIEREISRVCPSHRRTRHDEICGTTQSTCCDVLRTTCVRVRSCGESREGTAPPVRVERTWTSQRVERSAWCDVGALEGQRKKIGCGYEARATAVAAACVARNRRRCRETTPSNRLVGVSRGTSAPVKPELASLSRR